MDYSLLLATFKRAPQSRKLPQQRLLYDCLRSAILDGTIGQDTRLMASRALAEELGMARNSVIYAYERLVDEGFVIATRHGTVVARVGIAQMPQALEPADVSVELSRRVQGLYRDRQRGDDTAAFVSGVPALDAFPLSQWRLCIERAWRSMSARHLGYGNTEGHPALRHAIADYLKVSRGVRCSLNQVFITDGTQTSLDLCARLLADTGDHAWVENPGYNGARAAFQSVGLNLVPVPVDIDGMAPLREQWLSHPPKLIYITPSHQYPLGSVLSLERRLQLIDDARQAGAWIIEDDYDSEFRRDGPPLSAVQGLQADAPVIYLGTFSKTLFPSLRLGYMVVPAHLAVPMSRAMDEIARRGRMVEQVALADFMESGQFALHLRRMRRLYAQRRDALQAALQKYLREDITISGGAGGMHLSVRLNLALADTIVSAAARKQGLVVSALSAYCLPDRCGYGPGQPYNGFVLGYAGVPAEQMDSQVKRLAQIIDALRDA